MQTSLSRSLSPNTQKVIAGGIFAALFAVIVAAAYLFVFSDSSIQHFPADTGVDWRVFFRPAARKLLALQNPYDVRVFNPPWVFLLLSPLALLPVGISSSVMFALNFFAFGFVAYRLGAKPIPLLLFVLSPFALLCGIVGNVDWMVALGFLMPPQIGLFFVLVKPQAGIGIAIFWLVAAWRRGGLREAVRVFSPVALAFLLSFVLYGLWPLRVFGLMPIADANTSFGPAGIVIGLALLAAALKNKKPGLALSSGPFLSPYDTGETWSIALLGLGPNTIEFVVAVAASWVVWYLML